MKVYIVRNLDVDWDKLSSAIIVAESEEEAVEIFIKEALESYSPYDAVKGYEEEDKLEVEELKFENKGVIHTDWQMG